MVSKAMPSKFLAPSLVFLDSNFFSYSVIKLKITKAISILNLFHDSLSFFSVYFLLSYFPDGKHSFLYLLKT